MMDKVKDDLDVKMNLNFTNAQDRGVAEAERNNQKIKERIRAV